VMAYDTATQPANVARHTLLIADDDRLVLATLGRGLREAGFRVLEADDGQRAVEMCREARPALAIIDQQMPGLSGLEVAERLASEAQVPFIFLTAAADEQVVDSALQSGALAYLVKPLDLPQVIPTVRAALRRAGEIESLRAQTVQLGTALRQGREISMAIGLVMARLGVTQDEALERLRLQARSARVRMETLARTLISTQDESARLFRSLAELKIDRSDPPRGD
jgi:AmiR/NasT family two-component response regulator